MEHKIINTGDYLLIVDESEIKEGDWYIDLNLKQIFSKSNPQISKIEWQKKIIGHLPLNNSPILEGVYLLPEIEDGTNKFLNDEINYWYHETGSLVSEKIVRRAFSIGLKAKDKYKYTEEDLRKAMKYASEITNNKFHYMDKYIQSLQQPKMPVGFKCETERKLVLNLGIDIYNPNTHVYSDEPKTTTNSQGFTQLVGEYIY
jgi:hypothetical protein